MANVSNSVLEKKWEIIIGSLDEKASELVKTFKIRGNKVKTYAWVDLRSCQKQGFDILTKIVKYYTDNKISPTDEDVEEMLKKHKAEVLIGLFSSESYNDLKEQKLIQLGLLFDKALNMGFNNAAYFYGFKDII